MTCSDARGSATVELAVVAPALLALLGLVIMAGRITAAGSAVEQAAAAGARAASLARDERAAERSADHLVTAALRDQGVRCQETSTRVDTSGFAARIGTPATVSVEVRCVVPLRDVAVPGMPGQRTLTARATSPLDTYRGRG
ncbi:MAG TPA: TadE/TadG family type IV pilus assembly protein [Candidatus Nanopelagicales bacterium]